MVVVPLLNFWFGAKLPHLVFCKRFKFDFSGGMRAIAVTARTLRQRYLFVPQHMRLVHLVWLLLNFGPMRERVDDDGDHLRESEKNWKWSGARNAIVFVRQRHEVS